MDLIAYSIETEVELTHWWFVGRRRLFGRLIKDIEIKKDARILDIGSSTGTNLRMLHDLGYKYVEGLDQSDEAIALCKSKGFMNVITGNACRLPYTDGSFDLVLATDIIEHIDDDISALREIYRVLKPGGKTLISVPAFDFLWGSQDIISHHKRRYRGKDVLMRLSQAGLNPILSFYFNYILFVPILLVRKAIRWLNIKPSSENRLNSPLVNQLLGYIFAIDTWSAPRLHVPFGVSFLAIADKL